MSLRLKQVYESKGLTRREVASHMGLSENFIYKLERGLRNVNGDQLKQLAALLSVSTDEILGVPRPPKSSSA